MSISYEAETALAEALSDRGRRRHLIRRLNRALPPGRNRWFVSRQAAHNAAQRTAQRLSQHIGRPVQVQHHVYQPLGLRHYHLAAPGGQMLRMRFIYLDALPRQRETTLGETGQTRRLSTLRPKPSNLKPVSVSRSRPADYKRPTNVSQPLSPAEKRRISKAGWSDFNNQKQGNKYAALRTRKGEDIHHAIERQVLTRYPGVFTAAELNDRSNMRGIPAEKGGKKQLHGRAIRDLWDYHYRNLDAMIAANNLRPRTPAYNRLVREYLQSARAEIDWKFNGFFTEQRRAPKAKRG
jgi:hypothetical protein